MFLALETATIARREFEMTTGNSSHVAQPNEGLALVYKKTQQQMPDKMILIKFAG